jgi:prepilin-type processing-associated H-X9-DG protein
MYCPKCGRENVEGAQLCDVCGFALASIPMIKTSGLAITSLILGILSFFTFFITAIPAIIFGIIALVKINKSEGRLKGNGLAIAGIIIPAAVLPIILAILMPALSKAREGAKTVVCMSQMRQLGVAMQIYAYDHTTAFPTPAKWCDQIKPYLKQSADKVMRCPEVKDARCTYAMNPNVEKLGVKSPPDMVLLFESKSGWNQYGGPELLATENHRGRGCTILFCDGQVRFVNKKDIPTLKWTADANK